MPQKAVADLVEAHLAAHWTACPVEPTNRAGRRSGDETFLVVQYPVANSEQISVGAPGNNLWREEGAIRFMLMIPRGGGVDEGYALADQIADLFRGQQLGALETFGPSSPVADDGNEDGKFFGMAVVVPYQFDFFA